MTGLIKQFPVIIQVKKPLDIVATYNFTHGNYCLCRSLSAIRKIECFLNLNDSFALFSETQGYVL